jgi:hypothetical protein
MLKLERLTDEERTTVRLIGWARSEYLGVITNQMESCGPKVTLDLKEVMAVDLEIVRFLGSCEREGTELLHCPPYIREWISREQRLFEKNNL